MARRSASLRAEIARWGLRWFVKKRSHHQTIEQARATFHSIEWLIPYPPRGTVTEPITVGDGATADLITTPASGHDRFVLYLHGGAYRLGSPATFRNFTWRIATAARARVVALDYRLAPEHPFPAALEDALSAYRWLLSEIAPPKLALLGDSAGGGLALGLLLKLRDVGLPLPSVAVALSPWTDLALSGASITANAQADPMLNADDLPQFAAEYLRGADPGSPYASPLYGDPAGLPPTLFQVGSDEIMRDDTLRMAEKMIDAGCKVVVEVWPRMPHVWHLLAPMVPEARAAIKKVGAFIDERLATHSSNE